MNAGKSLKIALLKRDRTQTWLAEQMGLTHQSVSVLCNKPSMTMNTLAKVAKLLDYKPSEFIALGE